MALERIELDGSENGGTAGDKINLAIDEINFGRSINITPKIGVDIDTLIVSGIYEVNTNTPLDGVGELVVRRNTTAHDSLIQHYISKDAPLEYIRISSDNGANWSVWADTAQALFNDQVVNSLDTKATKDYVNKVIVNTFSGTTVPDSSLGKSGDLYHKYSTFVSTTIKSGLSTDNYLLNGFSVFYDNTELTGIWDIAVEPESRQIIVDWVTTQEHANNYSLDIDGTIIPLTITQNTSHTVDCTYDSGYDATIQGITTASSFTLKTDILSSSEADYTKFNNDWYSTPIFSALYEFNKVGNIGSPAIPAVTSTSYINANALNIPNTDPGTYEIKLNCTFGMSSTTKSFKMRFGMAVGGGPMVYETTSKEVKDITDKHTHEFSYPHVHGGGEINLEIDVAVEGDTGILDFSNIVVERKA